MENFLQEAFKRLSLLEDDFNYSDFDKDKIDELQSFIPDDVEIPKTEEIDVIDPNAYSENDLEDIYEGKIILECECCHSRIYKDKEDVVITDDVANVEDACPVCGNKLGFTIIGKIESYDPNKDLEDDEDLSDEIGDTLESDAIDTEDKTDESLDNEEYVINFAKESKESGHPVEDFEEFKSILADDGLEATDELYQTYLDNLSDETDESLNSVDDASDDSKKLDEALPLEDRIARKHLNSLLADDVEEGLLGTAAAVGAGALLGSALSHKNESKVGTAINKGGNKVAKVAHGIGDAAQSVADAFSDDVDEKLDAAETARMAEITKNGVVRAADREEYNDLHKKELEEADDVCPECGHNPCTCESDLDERMYDSQFDKDFDDAVDALEKEEEESKKVNEGLLDELTINTPSVDCMAETASNVMAAYQNANKWLDIVKEIVYTNFGSVFFSSFIHNLAHTMPVRFDKFGDILHTINMRVPYPATQYIPSEPTNIDEVFGCLFMILDSIKTTLNDFIKCTDETNHGLACAAEVLLNDIESEYPAIYRMQQEWVNSNGDLATFDKYVGQYLEHKDSLAESLDEADFMTAKDLSSKGRYYGANKHRKVYDKIANGEELTPEEHEVAAKHDNYDPSTGGRRYKDEALEDIPDPWADIPDHIPEDIETIELEDDEVLDEAKSSLDNKPFGDDGDEYFDEEEFTSYYDQKYPEDGTPFGFDGTICYLDEDSAIVDRLGKKIDKKLGMNMEGYPDFVDHDKYTYQQVARYIHELFKACSKLTDESLTEAVELHVDGEPIDLVKGDDGSLSVEVAGNSVETAEDAIEAPVEEEGAEEIVPLDDEDKSEIELNTPEEESDDDFDDFDEESFDEMGESFVRRVYENVKSFKTTGVKSTGKEFIIEGVITFKSGRSKKTEFIFENKRTIKSGKVILEGYNKTFSDNKNTFTLKGTLTESKFTPQIFKYNYSVKQINESNNSEVLKIQGKINLR